MAEQAKPALPEDEYRGQANKLSETQDGLGERVLKVTERIRELPDGEAQFAYEINLLETVAVLMNETTEILARPETGPPAIGAGLLSWKYNYGGIWTPIFRKKMVLSIVLMILAATALALRLFVPESFGPGMSLHLVYAGMVAISAPLVGALGFLGGNITFPR